MLDSSEQQVVIVGGGAYKLLLISRGQYQSWRVGAAQNNTIDACWAVAATIGAGVIIFVPRDDEGRFCVSPYTGFGDLVHSVAQVVITEFDDAVIQARRREGAVR